MAWLKVLLSALLVVVGFTVQNVTIVYWTEANISNFGILMLCGGSFFIIFGAALLIFAAVTGDWDALYPSDDAEECKLFVSPFLKDGHLQLTHLQVLATVGLLNALNGYGIVYASSPKRTPPLVQAILQNAAVIWSVPFSKVMLGDRKVYFAWEPLRAAFIIIASVCVSLAPTFASGASGSLSLSNIGWIAVYLAGLAFGASYNVMQQLYFIRVGALVPGLSNRLVVRHALRALFYANVFQPLSMAALLWLDLLPWFGTSSNATDFSDNTVFSLACSIGGPTLARTAGYDAPTWDCPDKSPTWAWVFIGGYIVSYVGAAQLNRESATFSMLTFVVVTMTTATFWLIPGTNPNPLATPLWSVLVSLVLSLAGSALWKQWESKIPAEEQFDVQESCGRSGKAVDDDGDDGYGYLRGSGNRIGGGLGDLEDVRSTLLGRAINSRS